MEDDFAEEQIDAIVEILREADVRDVDSVKITNPQKLKDISELYRVLNENLIGRNKIKCELYKPFLGSASIKITGKNIRFKKPSVVFKAAKLASNFEVYPKVNGDPCMAFTFDGLVKRIS